MSRSLFEIEQADGGFRVRNLDASGNGLWEYHQCESIKSVIGVEQVGYGTRASSNLRKNPIREDDHRQIIIMFNDDQQSKIEYNIAYVNNQPTWTNDNAGLVQATADINSWCGGGSSTFEAAAAGNTETPSVVENTTSGGAGSTTAGVKAVSILFEGTGGTLGGVAVNDGHVASFDASMANTLASIAYVVPNAASGSFPNSPRVVITYTT